MFLSNWKTSLFGIGGGILTMIANGGFHDAAGKFDWKTLAISASLAVVGIFAKDHNVTGGTVGQ